MVHFTKYAQGTLTGWMRPYTYNATQSPGHRGLHGPWNLPSQDNAVLLGAVQNQWWGNVSWGLPGPLAWFGRALWHGIYTLATGLATWIQNFCISKSSSRKRTQTMYVPTYTEIYNNGLAHASIRLWSLRIWRPRQDDSPVLLLVMYSKELKVESWRDVYSNTIHNNQNMK